MDVTPQATYYDFCSFCGADLDDIDYDERRPTRFCCEEHKVKYHNERRKIDRMKKRAYKAIADLHEIFVSTNGTELEVQSLNALLSLKSDLSGFLQGIRWYCTECGQTTFERPISPHTCSFCQHKDTYRVKL